MGEESVYVYGNMSYVDGYEEHFINGSFEPPFQPAFKVKLYRYMFIVIYSTIFFVCIVGNTLVLIVTAQSARMKTRTNLFLANLAVADLCVGIVCILPNLQTFLYFSWLLGTTMCKVYYFAESFSFCVSVLLLAAIAVERYIAVMHPLQAKELFTACRMHAAQILIWVFSAVYNIPLMAIFDTFEEVDRSGGVTMFCNIRDDIINLRIYYTINFILWYTLPLITMSVVYAIISWTLWHSGTIFSQQKTVSNQSSATVSTPMVRDFRSSANISSSSSGGCGSVSDCSQKDSGGSVGDGISRHGSGNIGGDVHEVSGRSHCGCCAELTVRLHINGDDCCGRCGVTANRCVGSRNEISPQFSPLPHLHTNGSPSSWPWSTREEAARGDESRVYRHQSFASRISCSHCDKYYTFEMTCMAASCLHNQSTHSKRQNGVVAQTLPTRNSHRPQLRRSYQPDNASEASTVQAFTCGNSTHRAQPTMTDRVLSSRRKVMRLLVLVLFTFAVCVLPHHVRLLMFYWNVYPDSSFGMSFFPPLAFISLYLNSAMNPVLYSLFSESFRRSLKECFRRPYHRGKSFLSRRIASFFTRDI